MAIHESHRVRGDSRIAQGCSLARSFPVLRYSPDLMPITVVVRSGGQEGEEAPSITLDAPMIVLGRGEGCEVRLPDASVSHRHATIRQRGSEYILQDEGSTNGTFIGGVRLGVQAPRMLRHGEVIRLGRIFLEVRLDALLATPQASQATKEIALALVARALEAQGEPGGPRLLVAEGPDEGKLLPLDEAGRAYVIGRGRDADLVLDDPDASRRHVQVVRRGELLLARDLGSKNGAALPQGRLSTEHDSAFHLGEALRLGGSTLVYENPAAAVIAELDYLGDEKMSDEDQPSPPLSSTTPRTSVPPSLSEPPPPEVAGAAPIVEQPEGTTAALARDKPRSSWTSTDVLVVLLAIGVLALSVVGLYWLLRG